MSKRDWLKHLGFTTAAAIAASKKSPMTKSNEPTIEQKDITIARFMGMEGSDDFIRQNYQYHRRWELLMPVVEKISKIKLLNWDNTPCTDPQEVCYPRTFGMPTEDGKRVMVRFNGFSCHEADTLIGAAHAAVYEVAEFHNQQKQTNGQNNAGTDKG